jgi:hypothetical protein
VTLVVFYFRYSASEQEKSIWTTFHGPLSLPLYDAFSLAVKLSAYEECAWECRDKEFHPKWAGSGPHFRLIGRQEGTLLTSVAPSNLFQLLKLVHDDQTISSRLTTFSNRGKNMLVLLDGFLVILVTHFGKKFVCKLQQRMKRK